MKIIKIPNNISIYYNKKKNLLICKQKSICKLINLQVKVLVNKEKKKLIILNIPIKKLSNDKKKQLNSLQGLIISHIKQAFIELTNTYYQKLKFVGVGYRAIKLNYENEKNIFLLKLGLSHPLYLSTQKTIKLFCIKYTKLFVYGNSYHKLTQTTSTIRLTKWPEPYKGKGILFDNEKIYLKEGKKI